MPCARRPRRRPRRHVPGHARRCLGRARVADPPARGRRRADRLRLGGRRLRRRRGASRLLRRHGGTWADRSPWGATSQRRAAVRPGAGVPSRRRTPRSGRAALGLARALAATTLDASPTACDASASPATPIPILPAVCAILQVASEGPLVDTFLDGDDLARPRAARRSTARWLAGGPVDERRLRLGGRAQRHRRTTRTWRSSGARERARADAPVRGDDPRARVPRHRRTEAAARPRPRRRSPPSSGPTGAICTTFSSGNSHTDTMLTVRALRDARGSRNRRARVRDERRVDRPRRRGRLPREHRQRGRARGRMDARSDRWRGRRRRGARGGDGPLRRELLGDRGRRVDGGARMTVVHYLNQFFAGLGGEEAADHEPVRLEGPQGPGQGARGRRASTSTSRSRAATTGSASTRTTVSRRCSAGSTRRDADVVDLRSVVRLGPVRLRVRCAGARGRAARHPGRGGDDAPTRRACSRARAQRTSCRRPRTWRACAMRVPVVASLASRLAAGEPVGTPDEEGYLPRGLRVNVRSDALGAERAVELLLAKLGGEVRTEIEPPSDRVAPPRAARRRCRRVVALVTEAGCVPQGNPDRLPTRHANVWLRYPIGDRRRARARGVRLGARGLRHHRGEPRPEPARAAGRGARPRRARAVRPGPRRVLHDERRATRRSRSRRGMGQEIGAEIREAGVGAVILTGT